ncbi:LpqB family beta-propeller domain-containing protein [Actinacidiphila sp. ITFR-21]|uniref:LpqB family beta-propeller domain-containing protein n=1 Tax=Actinacidiphila sp. ITFR-21 TaxID=3075199 RepID=UPI00288A9824|nr:LpqB family beta-propeller domain-containing protein [Streptomyces sp. ITFR-21]WNI15769.1 LpqB family beta-propeller domain-containing protein [Streptomyces sp. ITFR-21]
MRAVRSRGRLLFGVLPACAALLLAGCASMPSSGEVRKVGDGQRADSDPQVRVFPFAPTADEGPAEIVSGFLEATTGSETDFATAKKYLSKDAAAKWNPLEGITVYSSNDLQVTDDGGADDKDATMVSLSAARRAVVDVKHAYQPEQGDFRASFHVVKQKNGWRIDGLQDGLILSETDFQRLYHSANMYYFAKLGADALRNGGKQRLVADPVYLRNQEADPLVSAVSALLGGPTGWLAPVVTSAAPTGARLDGKASDGGVTLDDSQRLRVRLDGAGAARLTGQSCVLLAAQLFTTAQAQASAQLASVGVQRAGGGTLCGLTRLQALSYSPESLAGAAPRPYYIAADGHRLLTLSGTGTGTTATAVPGPFGTDKADLGSVAVRRDQGAAAGVRTNGRDLVVGPLIGDGPFGPVALKSTAADPRKDGLTAPSWDGLGDLWVADRDPNDPRLLVLRDGKGMPHRVLVPDLDGRVESLRVSSDGVRIALIVRQGASVTLQLGRIRRGTEQHPDDFVVSALRVLSPPGENVASVAWAGASQLVVLGTETGEVRQIQYLNTDGSTAPALQGINEATSVAASEDQSKPLLMSYNGGVYVLPADSNWKQVSPPGASPVYPG